MPKAKGSYASKRGARNISRSRKKKKAVTKGKEREDLAAFYAARKELQGSTIKASQAERENLVAGAVAGAAAKPVAKPVAKPAPRRAPRKRTPGVEAITVEQSASPTGYARTPGVNITPVRNRMAVAKSKRMGDPLDAFGVTGGLTGPAPVPAVPPRPRRPRGGHAGRIARQKNRMSGGGTVGDGIAIRGKTKGRFV